MLFSVYSYFVDKQLIDQINSTFIQETLKILNSNMSLLADKVRKGDALSLEIFALLSRLDENSADVANQSQLVIKVEEWERANL